MIAFVAPEPLAFAAPVRAPEGAGWPVGLIRADRIGRVRSINPAAGALLGLLGERAEAASIFTLLAPASPALDPRAARLLGAGDAARGVMRGPGDVRVAATLAREDDGGLTAILVDESAQAAAEAEAGRQRARFAALAAASPQTVVWTLDAEGRVTDWPPSAERRYGLPASAALGLPLTRLARLLDLDVDAEAPLGAGAVAASELRLHPIRDAEGAPPAGYVAVAGDPALAPSREAALRRLAALDPLTGVLNRRAFFAAGERALDRCRAEGQPLAVVALDLDRFKALNDGHGHAAGDAALRLMAEAALAALGPADLLGRLGGDEFAVVSPGADREAAVALARRIAAAIGRVRAPGGHLTASFGVAVHAAGDGELARTLARADAALYRAKADGRDRVAAA